MYVSAHCCYTNTVPTLPLPRISSVERWTRWTRNMGNFVSARKSAARSGTGSSGDTLPHSLLSAVLTSERQPNSSSDSDPSRYGTVL